MHDLDQAEFQTHSRLLVIIVTCKNEEDSIKNEGARVITTLYIDFSAAQGQLTPWGGILPKFTLIHASLPARMKKIQAGVFATFLPL